MTMIRRKGENGRGRKRRGKRGEKNKIEAEEVKIIKENCERRKEEERL